METPKDKYPQLPMGATQVKLLGSLKSVAGNAVTPVKENVPEHLRQHPVETQKLPPKMHPSGEAALPQDVLHIVTPAVVRLSAGEFRCKKCAFTGDQSRMIEHIRENRNRVVHSASPEVPEELECKKCGFLLKKDAPFSQLPHCCSFGPVGQNKAPQVQPTPTPQQAADIEQQIEAGRLKAEAASKKFKDAVLRKNADLLELAGRIAKAAQRTLVTKHTEDEHPEVPDIYSTHCTRCRFDLELSKLVLEWFLQNDGRGFYV